MFDEFLRERADGAGEPFAPFDPAADYDRYVDGRPRADGVRTFLASRGITLPEGTPGRPAGRRDRQRPRQPQERPPAAAIRDGRGRGVPGSVRVPAGRRATAGLRRAVVSSSANTPRRARGDRASTDLFEVRVDGVVAARASTCAGKPAPDTFLAAAPSCSASTRRRPPSSRTRWPGCAAGRAGGFGYVVGVDRVGPGRRAARARRRHRGDATSPSCSDVPVDRRHRRDPRASLSRRAVARPGDPARPGRAGPDRVGVRAVQRAHRAARQPRRGRAARPARHLPQLVLRAAPAAVRRGRLRLPRVRARRSSTSPTAS